MRSMNHSIAWAGASTRAITKTPIFSTRSTSALPTPWTTADRFTFFRMMAGQIARAIGAIATFMAKPFSTRTGSGAHMHYHLADAASRAKPVSRRGRPARPRPLEAAYQFIAGILEHARATLCGHVALGQLL